MINYDTVLSTFDDKLTLLQWLQKVEQALEGAGLERVEISQPTPTTAIFKFVFADGTSVTTPSVTLPRGAKGDTGATGATGATGNGIASITKTGTSGLIDTYTILYTNGSTQTFTVTNGAQGEAGQDGTDGVGISNISIDASGHLIVTLTDTSTIDCGELPSNTHMVFLTSITGTLSQDDFNKLAHIDGLLSITVGTAQNVYIYDTQDVDYYYYKTTETYANSRIKIDKLTRAYTTDVEYLAPFGSKINSETATNGQVLMADGNGGASWGTPSVSTGKYMHYVFATYGTYRLAFSIMLNTNSKLSMSSMISTVSSFYGASSLNAMFVPCGLFKASDGTNTQIGTMIRFTTYAGSEILVKDATGTDTQIALNSFTIQNDNYYIKAI